jgi:CubicO group peptidase (beta-lactamase class C family)
VPDRRQRLCTITLVALALAACAPPKTVATSRSATNSASDSAAANRYPHATEPIGQLREIYDGVLTPDMAVNTFRNIDRLLPTRTVQHSATPMPLPRADSQLTELRIADKGRDYTLDQFMELNRVAGLLVLKDGRIALERYRYGNTERTRWMSMSVAKSITSTLVGAALQQGLIHSLNDSVTQYVPALANSAYAGVSIRDVLMMSSGVQWSETYTDPTSDRRRLLEAQISLKAGSAMKLMASLPRSSAPGTVNHYSTGETQVVAEVLRAAIKMPIATYLSDRIWSKYGMEADAKWWLDSPDGIEIGGSGFSATLRDYGRFGLFFLNGGIAGGEHILPPGWTTEASTPKLLRNDKKLDYGYLWWPGTSAQERRDKAFTAQGIHGQFLYINPAAKVVIVVWSARPQPTGTAVVSEWSFFDAVVRGMR